MSAIQPTKNTGLIVDEFLRYANEHLSTVTGIIYTTSNYPPLGNPGPGVIPWQGYSVPGFKESTIIDEALLQEVEIENIIIDEEFAEQGLPLNISVVDPTADATIDEAVLAESKFDGLDSEEESLEEFTDEEVSKFIEDVDVIYEESFAETSIEPQDPNDKALNDPNYVRPVRSRGILNGGGGGPAPEIIIDPKKLKEKFMVQTTRVIRELEGGYYHPDMQTRDPVGFKVMGESGETMYGIDRLKGAPATTDSVPARQFWKTIDSQNARKNWRHLYIPPAPLRDTLIYLAAQTMESEFNRMMDRKNDNGIVEPNLRKIVLSYDPLLFHFIYAAWNGGGWFQGWARIINAAYRGNKNQAGITDPAQLARLMISKRLNNTGVLGPKQKTNNDLIATGGRKIAKLFGYA
jgi:hypothetical protein